MIQVKVSGIVYAVETIRSPVYYATATFNDIQGLHVTAEGSELKFYYEMPFTAKSVDSLLTSLITEHGNVKWNLTVKTV